jgi:hypothetical protein
MESQYAIDRVENLVRVTVWGELTADGLIELMNRVGADPQYFPGMNAIADYREARGNWDYSEVQGFRDYVVRISAGRQPSRWAAVVRPGALVAVGHVVILISEAVGASIRMQLFESSTSALRWVRGEIDD